MAIAKKPGGGGGGPTTPINIAEIQYSSVISPTGLGVGLAVAIIEVGSQLEYILCDGSATGHGNAFAGFTSQIITPGGHGKLIVGRGSLVTPVVEYGVPLTPNVEVFLSMTPGEVTQDPPDTLVEPGETSIRLGMAVSATQMVLTTDAYVQFGG